MNPNHNPNQTPQYMQNFTTMVAVLAKIAILF